MPMAFAAMGDKDVCVMPGMALISKNTGCCVFEIKKSALAIPLIPIVLYAITA